MTTLVGIKAKNGVVLASDKRATQFNIIVSKEVRKIIPITDNILIAAAGTVADLQHLAKLLRTELKLRELYSRRKVNVIEAANLLSHILFVDRYYMPYLVELFVAGPKNAKEFGIFSLDAAGGLTEVEDYFVAGSGGELALGFLEGSYKKGITVEEAKELAKKAIMAAIGRDVFSGDGIELYVITSKGIKNEYIDLRQTSEAKQK
jgi:proteasome beta subunit